MCYKYFALQQGLMGGVNRRLGGSVCVKAHTTPPKEDRP